MTVKELKQKLSELNDDTELCIQDSMNNFYEPIKNIEIVKVRKHDDVYADADGKRFMDNYKKKFIKQDIKKIASINC